jgi:putative ferrous iron transport protein C
VILSELRNFIKQQRRVALKDLSAHFDVDVEALRGMMQKWVSKGYVKKLPAGTSCASGCCQCDPALIELYEWVENSGD